jgi:hypothetical protein
MGGIYRIAGPTIAHAACYVPASKPSSGPRALHGNQIDALSNWRICSGNRGFQLAFSLHWRVRGRARSGEHQPLYRARDRDRLGALRHRQQDRTEPRRSRAMPTPRNSRRSGPCRAPSPITTRPRAIGGSRVPPRLGTRPLFRDHLTSRTVTPAIPVGAHPRGRTAGPAPGRFDS